MSEWIPIYAFQCTRCFIVSGHMSKNPDDAPACCGGKKMAAVVIEPPGDEDE
jgi:hypothetical protein